MKYSFKEMPYEASLFFIAWIWLIVSIGGMTVVNGIFPGYGPVQNVCLVIAGIIYLFPAAVVGLKICQSRKIAGLPLLICAAIISICAIAVHLRLNVPDFDFGLPVKYEQMEIIMMILLTVAVPLSFCLFAQSAGCRESRNMKILTIFAVSDYFALTAIYLTGMRSAFAYSVIPVWYFLYELLISPVLGVLYIQMMTAAHREKKDLCSQDEKTGTEET